MARAPASGSGRRSPLVRDLGPFERGGRHHTKREAVSPGQPGPPPDLGRGVGQRRECRQRQQDVPDRTFVGAFQSIDRAIINPWFMAGGFLGALVFTGLAAVLHLGEDERSVLPWVVVALVLYLAVFVTTLAVHVPRNNGIKAAGDPDRIADLAAVRQRFDEATWNRWNVVRAVMSVVAFGCLAWALVLHGRI
jgi:uncharacterized membrane protein